MLHILYEYRAEEQFILQEVFNMFDTFPATIGALLNWHESSSIQPLFYVKGENKPTFF